MAVMWCIEYFKHLDKNPNALPILAAWLKAGLKAIDEGIDGSEDLFATGDPGGPLNAATPLLAEHATVAYATLAQFGSKTDAEMRVLYTNIMKPQNQPAPGSGMDADGAWPKTIADESGAAYLARVLAMQPPQA